MGSVPAYNLPTLILAGDSLAVINSYKYKDALKQVGCRWNPERKAWSLMATPENFRKLTQAVPGLKVDKSIVAKMTEAALAEAEQQSTTWDNAQPIEPMPLKTVPFKHQVAAYNLALSKPSSGLLMEQGCGKTMTAIAVAGRRFQRRVSRVLVVAPHQLYLFGRRSLTFMLIFRTKLKLWKVQPQSAQACSKHGKLTQPIYR